MVILSWLYRAVVFIRRKLYQFKCLKSIKIDGVTVICVGNITVGGTGKTPIVQHIVQGYLSKGEKVAIVSRGYKGKRMEDPMIVSTGEKIVSNSLEVGDEPYFHAVALPSVPVIVAKKRSVGVQIAKNNFHCTIVVLDDGFQHFSLIRDKNIVLIDATDPFGKNQLLPLGRLREPISGLKRADEIIITKTNLVDPETLSAIVNRLEPFKKPIFMAPFTSILLRDEREQSLEFLLGKHVAVVSAIAKPENIYKTVSGFRPNRIDEVSFSDHHCYHEEDISRFYQLKDQKVLDYFVTTEKDWVKIKPLLLVKQRKDWVVIKQKYTIGVYKESE